MLCTLLLAMALPVAQAADAAPGQLIGIPDKDGQPALVMPLKHTSVTADVAGIASRVVVVQTFTNPSRTPLEAVYTFPLPATAAVDRMRVRVGDRVIEGEVKLAQEARAIYNAARAAGQTAALLDQERPNVFTQSIANIVPGATVQVEIRYVDLLKYEDGQFEFSFPMVVGPRNTMNAPDPTQIAPPVTPKGTRTGHDVSVTVHLDAGMSLQTVSSVLHAVTMQKRGAGRYDVSLSNKSEIPNRDFILRWAPAGNGVTEGVVAHDGTFCLTIVPPPADAERFASPREVVFVMDQSGSQQGFPIEKSKELTLAMIDRLRAGDLFNVVTFTTGVNHLWPESMPNTPDRVREAKEFVRGLTAGGGTNFLPPLTATMTTRPPDGRLKLIVFNTDGFVGDDFDILAMVQANRLNARLFTFGIGNSVNRFLVDGMSAEGRGASEIVTLADDVAPAIERFLKRTQTPVLTDVRVDFEGVPVHDVTPSPAPDLFSDSPLVVFGRYEGAGTLDVTLSGSLAGKPWSRTVEVQLPAEDTGSSGVRSMWARKRLDDMVREDWMAASRTARKGAEARPDDARLAAFALQHGIMSQWTSFVAVEKRVVNIGGRQRTVRVPVEMADGVSYEGVYGKLADTTVFAGVRPGTFNRAASAATLRGGYGGAAAGAGPPMQGAMPPGITRVTYDPTDNSLIVQGMDEKDKVDARLAEKTGILEVAVLVVDWPKDWKKLLTEAGLTVDEALNDLKVVYGRIDAKRLLELAKLRFVLSIKPIEE